MTTVLTPAILAIRRDLILSDPVNIPFLIQFHAPKKSDANFQHSVNLVILLDTSRSMIQDARIECAKQVIKHVGTYQNMSVTISLIAFDKTAKRIHTPYSLSSDVPATLFFNSSFSNDSSQASTFEMAIEAVSATGDATNYDAAFMMAFEEIQLLKKRVTQAKTTLNAILFVSDGEPNEGDLMLENNELKYPAMYWENFRANMDAASIDFVSCIGIGKNIPTQPLNAICQSARKSMMHLISDPVNISEAMAPTLSVLFGAGIIRGALEFVFEPVVTTSCIWEFKAAPPIAIDNEGRSKLEYSFGILGHNCSSQLYGSFTVNRDAIPCDDFPMPLKIGTFSYSLLLTNSQFISDKLPITIQYAHSPQINPYIYHLAELGKVKLDIKRAKDEVFSKCDAIRFAEAHRLIEERKIKAAAYVKQNADALELLRPAVDELVELGQNIVSQNVQNIKEDSSWYDTMLSMTIKASMDKSIKEVLAKFQAPKYLPAPSTFNVSSTQQVSKFAFGANAAKQLFLQNYVSMNFPYEHEPVANSFAETTRPCDLEQMIPNVEHRIGIYLNLRPFPVRDDYLAHQLVTKNVKEITLLEWMTIFYSSFQPGMKKDSLKMDLAMFFCENAPIELLFTQIIHRRNPSATVINIMVGAYGELITMCMHSVNARNVEMIPTLQPLFAKNSWKFKADTL